MDTATINQLKEVSSKLDDALAASKPRSTTRVSNLELLARMDDIPNRIIALRTLVNAVRCELEDEQAVWYSSTKGEMVRISQMNNEHLINSLHRLAYVRALAKAEVSKLEEGGTYVTEVQKIRSAYELIPMTNSKIRNNASLVDMFPIARSLESELRKRELPILIKIYHG